MLPSFAESIRRRDSSPAAQTCSNSAVHVPPCTRQSKQDDAACYAVSENRLFSLAKLTGMLATGAESICEPSAASYLVRTVSCQLISHQGPGAVDAQSLMVQRRLNVVASVVEYIAFDL